MQTSEFCYWLQGFFELSDKKALSVDQVEIIQAHLALVFIHDLDHKQLKDKLQATHDSAKPKLQFVGIDDKGNVYRC